MIILCLPPLSTWAKLRKHKSNKLAVLVYSDAWLYYHRIALFFLPERLLGEDGTFSFAANIFRIQGVLITSRLIYFDRSQ